MSVKDKPVLVSIKQGKLSGKIEQDFYGKSYISFIGIPYAKPPINELKFKAPLPPEPWTGTKDAVKEGDDYPQIDAINKREGGSHDCLYLNVYTPTLKPVEPMSVMVWIHGTGMFMCGSGQSDSYGPDYLMRHDVVLVTFNYRLGIAGFLNLEDESLGVPGNAGLKDMVMVLKWVQENIKEFGGDADSVTIAGQGAGAASVHLLMLSEMAKGLFHRAIAQSGSALCPWLWSENVGEQLEASTKVTQKMMKILNMRNGNEKELLKKLQKMDYPELYDLEQLMFDVLEMGTIRNFCPIIEKNVEGAFLTQRPVDIILSRKYNHVPLLMGFNNLDGAIQDLWREGDQKLEDSSYYVTNVKLWQKDQWRMALPSTLHHWLGAKPMAKLKEIGEVIMNCYSTHSVKKYLYSFQTDNMFARDIIFSAEFHAKTSDESVYLYEMSIDTEMNVMKKKLKIPYSGATFSDDIYYLFSTCEFTPQMDSLETQAIEQIAKIWTDFMKTGDPNAGVTSRSWFWAPISETEVSYLKISGDSSTGINLSSKLSPLKSRLEVWRIVYQVDPSYAKLFDKGLYSAKDQDNERKIGDDTEGTEDKDDKDEDETIADARLKKKSHLLSDERFEKISNLLSEYCKTNGIK